MVDNLKLVLPFLKFESKDDFYYLQILQRKKENPQLGSNSRVIKNYYIRSEEHLLNRYDEIKKLCQIFNARASIRLNKRSFKKVGMKTMVNLSNTMMNEEYSFLMKSYDRACGLGHNDKEKKWILDIDFIPNENEFNTIIEFINNIEPKGDKLIGIIPSKVGIHLITNPFNLNSFKERFPSIEVHKDNPTNLYIN